MKKIKAIRLNVDGSPVKNSEREFTEHHWTAMCSQFGDKLRWERVKEKKEKVKRKVVKEQPVKDIEDRTEENINIE